MAPSSDVGGAPLAPEKGYDPFSDEPLDGKYLTERLLGQGGMGAVYRATHVGTKRTVAVKIIHAQFSNNEEFVERFRREAEASGRLRHPNVVDVTDFGFARTRSGQVAYLVNILIAPLTAIMTAQLYLKTRQAGGEVLRDAIERFEALEIPRSRWQARMKTRSFESDRISTP